MALIEWESPQLEQEMLLSPQERLNQEAVFSLGDHALIDPEETRGYVNAITELEPVSMAGEALPDGVQLFEISVVDPYVAADPKAYELVRDHAEKLEDLIRREGFDPLEERRKEHPYMKDGEIADDSFYNRFTTAWLAGENVAPLKAWHSNVPTAEALGYLTNPCDHCTILDKDGMPYISSPETAAHLRFVDDAVAIRDRGVAMQAIAEGLLNQKPNGSDVRWLSLASGTGEPSIAASQKAAEANNLNISLDVADINPKSLTFVKQIAEKYGFDSNVTTIIGNILKPDFPVRLAKKTGTDEQYAVVENMGFEEYLPQKGDELGAYLDLGLPQASEFTKMAYDFVEPGGSLISGNMVYDRPQRDFVFGIVNWPIINARSEESILRVYQEAGIPMDQIKLYRVRDELTGAHVYDIVEVTKPHVEIEDPSVTTISRVRKAARHLISNVGK